MSAVHIQVDIMTALSYLLKMEGTKNPDLMQISKEIWEFLLRQGITITVKHLPGNLNCKADWESYHQKNSSEWKLVPSDFLQDLSNIGEETKNRPVCFKVVKSTSTLLLLKAGSQLTCHGSSSTELVSQEPICIPPICLDLQSTEKSREGESGFSDNSNSNFANPKFVPRTLPLQDGLLKGPQNQHHHLIQNQTMQLTVWVVSGKVRQRKKYQKWLQTLLPYQEEKVLF